MTQFLMSVANYLAVITVVAVMFFLLDLAARLVGRTLGELSVRLHNRKIRKAGA